MKPMLCKNCTYWTRNRENTFGECTGLTDGDAVEIEVRGDGYVEEILTLENFFCRNYFEKEEST